MTPLPFDQSSLQIGDIVFIRIANFLYRRVAEATQSWTSHVGMFAQRQGREWIVAESSVPRSRFCPLERFLDRSEAGQFAIKRLKDPLDAGVVERLQAGVRRRLGKWYHLGFKLDSPRQFCSKFVYEIYEEAMGVKIGSLESFRELLSKNPNTPLLFWKLWFCGWIPWNRRTITPASLYESELLETVCENAGAMCER